MITINKDRDDHLARLVEGLSRGRSPDELIVVEMGQPTSIRLPERTIRVPLDGPGLPLAAARNAGRAAASSDILIFLDVDCIPSASLVDRLSAIVAERDAVVCSEVLYLPVDAATPGWTEADLVRVGVQHPARCFVLGETTPASHPGLFWSLAFAMRVSAFDRLDGFDEAFTGYGAEDTDFGVRASSLGLPILFSGASRAFHQRHDAYDPPLQHVADIARNAVIFHHKHGSWPMRSWLDAFAALGLIAVRGDGGIDLLRMPTEAERAAARLAPDRPF